MSNSWLCRRTKLLQLCQIRNLTSSSWFQSRCNNISLGCSAVECNEDDLIWKTSLESALVSPIEREHPLLSWKGKRCLLQALEINNSKQSDFLSLFLPHASRNQELIKSLGKTVEPVVCNDAIYVGKVVEKCTPNLQLFKDNNKSASNAANSVDVFSCVDESLGKDMGHCMNMNATKAKLREPTMEMSSDSSTSAADGRSQDEDDDNRLPSALQLEIVKNYYLEILPGFHKRGELLARKMHHNDIVFENNFREKSRTTQGVHKYVWELNKMRAMASFKYPRHILEVQSITTHVHDGYVKLHWRAYVLTNWKFIRHFITLLFRPNSIIDTIDGISTFYVNKDGKIVRHRLERRIRMENKETNPVKNLAAKTVEMVGLASKTRCDGEPKVTS